MEEPRGGQRVQGAQLECPMASLLCKTKWRVLGPRTVLSGWRVLSVFIVLEKKTAERGTLKAQPDGWDGGMGASSYSSNQIG